MLHYVDHQLTSFICFILLTIYENNKLLLFYFPISIFDQAIYQKNLEGLLLRDSRAYYILDQR